jgi:SAM-dependent methyltransferase
MSEAPSPADSTGNVRTSPMPGATLSEPDLERPCPVCASSQNSRLFAPARLDLARLNEYAFASRKIPENMHLCLYECRQCDTLYASPVFAGGSLAAAYRDAAYDSAAIAQCAARTYGRFLPALAPRLPDCDGALDVGAGDGAFVAQLLQQGFTNVVGVEPSLAAAAAAPPDIRGLIRTGMFDEREFEPQSLSLVTCFQTIEHLGSPLPFCEAAFRLLRPDGALFLIGHNRRSLSARLLGRNSPIFDIEHLQLFSPRSLAALLAAAGFRDVRVSTVINRYPLTYWGRLFPMPGALKPRVGRLLEITRIGKLTFPLPAGNIAAIGFKR